jgi:hypothetical protein
VPLAETKKGNWKDLTEDFWESSSGLDSLLGGEVCHLGLVQDDRYLSGAKLHFERDEWDRWIAAWLARHGDEGEAIEVDHRAEKVSEIAPSVLAPPTPVQRSRGAAEPRNDGIVLKAMLDEATRLTEAGKTFSVQDYVLAHTNDIEGNSDKAKIRRLQRKFSEATKSQS